MKPGNVVLIKVINSRIVGLLLYHLQIRAKLRYMSSCPKYATVIVTTINSLRSTFHAFQLVPWWSLLKPPSRFRTIISTSQKMLRRYENYMFRATLRQMCSKWEPLFPCTHPTVPEVFAPVYSWSGALRLTNKICTDVGYINCTDLWSG